MLNEECKKMETSKKLFPHTFMPNEWQNILAERIPKFFDPNYVCFQKGI